MNRQQPQASRQQPQSNRHVLFLLLPWLSLAWGLFSATLIGHNAWGIHKVLIFMGLYAVADLMGFSLPRNGRPLLSWVTLTSQQTAAQYILFFALPLLWRADNQVWLAAVGILAVSTLWDPFFIRCWQNSTYRLLLTIVCLSLVCGLCVVTWFPDKLERSSWIFAAVCVVAFVSVLRRPGSDVNGDPATETATALAELSGLGLTTVSRVLLIIIPLLIWLPVKIPAVGVWLAEGEIVFDDKERSVECVTRIGAPQGFKGEVHHRWRFADAEMSDDVIKLPPITGNGIDEKPYTTRSRKKEFAQAFEGLRLMKIDCFVELPGAGVIGAVRYAPEDDLL